LILNPNLNDAEKPFAIARLDVPTFALSNLMNLRFRSRNGDRCMKGVTAGSLGMARQPNLSTGLKFCALWKYLDHGSVGVKGQRNVAAFMIGEPNRLSLTQFSQNFSNVLRLIRRDRNVMNHGKTA